MQNIFLHLQPYSFTTTLNWITTFRDFIRFVLKQHETSKIIQALHREKLQDHRQFAVVLSKTIDVLDK
ncbi:MAG: hypothetical protein KDD62_09145, partial [Bdellovibrionales bacterium]|nr:hypothetical protein [Bdellovibrionales bacterium]